MIGKYKEIIEQLLSEKKETGRFSDEEKDYIEVIKYILEKPENAPPENVYVILDKITEHAGFIKDKEIKSKALEQRISTEEIKFAPEEIKKIGEEIIDFLRESGIKCKIETIRLSDLEKNQEPSDQLIWVIADTHLLNITSNRNLIKKIFQKSILLEMPIGHFIYSAEAAGLINEGERKDLYNKISSQKE